jgi:hypothetical protein
MMILVTFCEEDLSSFPEGSLGTSYFLNVGNPGVSDVSGGGFVSAPIRFRASPSARARKSLGTGADIFEAYELDEESDLNDVSESDPEPEPDSESESEYGLYAVLINFYQ